MVTSSFNKIYLHGSAGKNFGGSHLFRSRLVDRYLPIDDVNGFFSTSNIFAAW
jgi:hypothetical protein